MRAPAPAMGWITRTLVRDHNLTLVIIGHVNRSFYFYFFTQDGDPHARVGEEGQSTPPPKKKKKKLPIPLCVIVPLLVIRCQTTLPCIDGGSKIRLRGVTAWVQVLKIWWLFLSIIYRDWNFHPNLSKTFWVVLQTVTHIDRQTGRQTAQLLHYQSNNSIKNTVQISISTPHCACLKCIHCANRSVSRE